MKKQGAILLFLLSGIIANAQSPNWDWVRAAGGNAVGNAVVADTYGNIYVTGSFTGGSISFGEVTLSNTDSTSPGFYILKLDSSNHVIWAESAQGSGEEELSYYGNSGTGIAADVYGNVYVMGYFVSPILIFGRDTLISTDNTGNSFNAFIVKYDSSGKIIWARSPIGSAFGDAISADGNGNCYVTGKYYDYSITFGSTTLTTFNFNNYLNFFIAKYDSSGNAIWAHGVDTAYSENGDNGIAGTGISTDADGNSFVTGYFQTQSATFGNTILINPDTTGYYPDFFVVKYDSSGKVIWAESAGVIGTDFNENGIIGQAVAIDAADNVYVTGTLADGMVTFGNDTLFNSGNVIFITKYNAAGNVIWTKGTAGASGQSNGISADANGNIYITGYFGNQSITFGNEILTDSGSETGFFIVKYDASGDALWAKTTGGTGNGYGYGTSVDDNGNVYVTGEFGSPDIVFGPFILPVSSHDGNDQGFFVAKLDNTITGIATEGNTDINISIFPNPSNGTWQLTVPGQLIGSTIEVFNSIGQLVYQSEITKTFSEISMPAAANGVYVLRIVSNDYNVATKLVKE